MGICNIKITNGVQVGETTVEVAGPRNVEMIATSAASAATSIQVGNTGDVIIIETDTNVWVKIEEGAPTAAIGDQHLILAGSDRQFTQAAVGSRIAVVDA